MRLQQLRGRPVVDPVTARNLGVVCGYRLDAVAGRLAALEVARDAETELIPAASIQRVGRHAVMLTGQRWTQAAAQEADTWLDAGALVTLMVLYEDGTDMGRLADAEVDPETLAIQGYRLRASLAPRLLGRPGKSVSLAVVACSRDIMVVRAGGAASPIATEPLATLKPEDRPTLPPEANRAPVVSEAQHEVVSPNGR